MGDKRKRSEAVEDAVEVADVKKLKKSAGDKTKKESKKEKKLSRDEAAEQNGITDAELKSDKKSEKKTKDKKDKKEKKDKKKEKQERKVVEDGTTHNGVEATTNGEAENKEEKKEKKDKKKQERKEKKEKKEKKRAKANGCEEVKPEEPNPTEATSNGQDEQPQGEDAQHEGDDHIHPDQKQARFVVFISNLPYSANHETVSKHFAKLQPIHIRVPTERDGKKARGFAFVEFGNYDRMKTCLKLYHHTMFDDGKSPARKIGIELTAGGGGSKSETRKARIEEKNKKLNEERARAVKEAAKRKRVEEKKKEAGQQNDETGNDGAEEAPYGDLHPSRRFWFQ
ncbi:predicted protein [Uncinocarpus reesii 1704]|uniref:RRM domain-containing protein n=1 Tax=Uncinocarpus reesii (strain UAMH 1704) TaxID=336963 RepID=C4JE45_UNCRE|nr:uncharacterized protein UREG_00469 [Uncinocarpus reesii 1704]EEP75623.1 predicted protein [Uncinocarpus reesii 1704]